MIDLKPCPFCGGEATIIDHLVKHFAKEDFEEEYSGKCSTCGVETRCYKTEEAAAEAWNKREEERVMPFPLCGAEIASMRDIGIVTIIFVTYGARRGLECLKTVIVLMANERSKRNEID